MPTLALSLTAPSYTGVGEDGYQRPVRAEHFQDQDIRSFLSPDLLTLVDLGPHRLDHQQSIDLYDDPILSGSTLDRLANASYQIVVESESYRQRLSPRLALLEHQEGA